jgi:integrase
MAKTLTAKSVENIKPPTERIEIPDGGCRGLYLVVQPSGRKSWAIRYRYGGRSVKLTLSGALTLAAARRDATNALHELERGNDPAAARKLAKVKAAIAAGDTVAAICAEYLQREGKKLRTAYQYERLLRRHVYPTLGDRQIDTVKRSEIVRILDKVEDDSGARTADVTLAALRRIFNWFATRSDEFRSPIVRGMNRQNAADHRRSRILDDDEIRKLWTATADGQPFSALVRFLLLTTARRGEAAGMRWDEVRDGIWTLPASRSKTKVEVARPLSQAAQAVLAGQPKIADWVFTTAAGTGPLQSFSEPKRALDSASGVSGYRLHDLRRTSRSLLSRAGINGDVAEKCLGHSRGDIVERYDKYGFVPEMARAFEALASLIKRIVDPGDSAVLAFRR